MSDFHQLTIKQVIKETPNAVSIAFEVPSHLEDTYSFVPGQYLTLKKEIEGKEVRRAYSISSATASSRAWPPQSTRQSRSRWRCADQQTLACTFEFPLRVFRRLIRLS